MVKGAKKSVLKAYRVADLRAKCYTVENLSSAKL